MKERGIDRERDREGERGREREIEKERESERKKIEEEEVVYPQLLHKRMMRKKDLSDSTSKTEEKAPSFIFVKYHFGSEKRKRIFLKKGPDSNPFFGPKRNLLCFPLAIQGERHVQ